ncbi:DUF4234 domain-containing protein [Ruminococcaceae bacterium OttesenSCG-928-A16]|nr:DUF4234 domain-containing protein [Ruminococcaceae bacterium OttesenSCG-928-A16]
MMKNRNIALYVILSIVTCGIFYIYWYYCIADDFYNQNPQLQNNLPTSPILTIVLNVVTCGLYGIYVAYVWGKATPEIMARYGRQAEDRSILYLIFSVVGLQIVTTCMIQNDFNNTSVPPVNYGGQPPVDYGTQAPGGYPPQQPMTYQPQPEVPMAPVEVPQVPVEAPQVPVEAPQVPVEAPQAPVEAPQAPVDFNQQPPNSTYTPE